IRNRNFPYVVLGRFLYMADLLRKRNHARRDRIEVHEGDLQNLISGLTESQQRSLHLALGRLSRQKDVPDLEKVLAPLLVDTA
ncbi:MAG: hypothetical protein WD601_03060, partial [Pseudohongiellaceae bacterium]